MPKIFGNNINIYYEDSGNTSKPVLLFVGGLTRDHSIWSNIISYFTADFRVIAPDNRGAGQTDKPVGLYTVEMLAEDLNVLLKEIGVQSAYVVGHSMGGFASQFLAARYPEKVSKLVLCNTCIKQPAAGKIYLNERLDLLKNGASIEEMTRTALPWIFAPSFLNEEKIQNIIGAAKNNQNPQPRHALEAQINACLSHDSSKILHQIISPTLIVTGKEDRVMTEQVSIELKEKIPDSHLKVIDNAAHMLQIEQPDIFQEIVKSFITHATLYPFNEYQ